LKCSSNFAMKKPQKLVSNFWGSVHEPAFSFDAVVFVAAHVM